LSDLRRDLVAIAHEMRHLRDRMAGIDGLHAEISRLLQEADRLRAERDELQDVLARIGLLAERARPRP
jgi:uncharacterized coiled-coil DUF342 family protein